MPQKICDHSFEQSQSLDTFIIQDEVTMTRSTAASRRSNGPTSASRRRERAKKAALTVAAPIVVLALLAGQTYALAKKQVGPARVAPAPLEVM